MTDTNSILTAKPFVNHRAYTLWRLDPPARPGGKPLKVPLHPDATRKHSTTYPARPMAADECAATLQAARLMGLGHDRPGEIGYLGYGFRPSGTGLACLDVDDCLVDGQWSAKAQEVAGALPGALLELSHSGRGLHLWFSYSGEGPGKLTQRDGLELYSDGQFIAAGRVLQGDASVDLTHPMRDLVARHWPATTGGREVTDAEWPTLDEAQRQRVRAEILSAARVLDLSSYHDWVAMGNALASLGDDGYPLWMEISSWHPSYDESECERKWGQLSADRTDYRALFAKAQRAGWVNPQSTEAKVSAAVATFGQGLAPGAMSGPNQIDEVVQAVPGVPPAVPPGAAPLPALSPPMPAPGLTGQSLNITSNDGGAIPSDLATVAELVSKIKEGQFVGRDDFLGQIMIRDGDRWRVMVDEDYVDTRIELQRCNVKPIKAGDMRDAVMSVARRNRFDSAQEWARGLAAQWDGVPRVSGAMHRYYRTEDTPYTRAVGEYLFTALAGRALEPGCQADMALVLVGLQGGRKTSAVSALAPFPDSFVEIDLSKRDDDLSRRLRGKLVGELAELRGLRGRDQEAVKAWVSRRTESWVEKYETSERRFARRLVLLGTSNEEDGFLDDPTGERRWLPAHAGIADVEGIERDRLQLWAEGAAMFANGGIRWQEAERLAVFEHPKFKVVDEWTEIVRAWLERPDPATFTTEARGSLPFQIHEILTGALRVSIDKIDQKAEKRVAKILRGLGYFKKILWQDGKTVKRWVSGKG